MYELIPETPLEILVHSLLFLAELCTLRIFFFLCVINDWNKPNPKICNSTSYLSFKNALINFINLQGTKSSIFMVQYSFSIKLLTKLQLGFSHLRKHEFRQF